MEDDWSSPGRQAEDEARALEIAVIRKNNTRNQHSREDHSQDNGRRRKWKNGTDSRKRKMGKGEIHGTE